MRNIFLILFCASCLWSQTDTGAILGSIQDGDRAVITGAMVSVQNEKTGQVRETVSNQTGLYTIPLLSPANYTIRISAPGFASMQKSGLR